MKTKTKIKIIMIAFVITLVWLVSGARAQTPYPTQSVTPVYATGYPTGYPAGYPTSTIYAWPPPPLPTQSISPTPYPVIVTAVPNPSPIPVESPEPVECAMPTSAASKAYSTALRYATNLGANGRGLMYWFSTTYWIRMCTMSSVQAKAYLQIELQQALMTGGFTTFQIDLLKAVITVL